MTYDRNRRQISEQGRRAPKVRFALLILAIAAPVLALRSVDAPVAAAAPPSGASRGQDDRNPGSRAFAGMLGRLERTTMAVGGARAIDIRLNALGATARSGEPVLRVPATARDRTTGAEGEIMIGARLVTGGDRARLSVRPVPAHFAAADESAIADSRVAARGLFLAGGAGLGTPGTVAGGLTLS